MNLCRIAILKLLLILSTSSTAATIGSITEQVNAVPSIQRQKQTLTGAKGTGLEMLDTVRTQQGKVGLTFADNTKVQVTENSKLVIDDFVYDPSSKTGGKLAINIALGTVRYASGQIAKNSPQSVAINTPTATIGVRGTDFSASVDELGRSTIILLPSCPFGWTDIKRDCVTGEISITTEEGMVILNQPFQATQTQTRESKPSKPVILKLDEDGINNMLMLSPPKELKSDDDRFNTKKGVLDVDFLKYEGLANSLDAPNTYYLNRLDVNFLDQNFLTNILDMIDAMMKAQLNLLNSGSGNLLPDYIALTGVKAVIEDPIVQLCRDDGSNVQCIQTQQSQNSTIIMQQGSIEIKNRVNAGGNTNITVRQSN